MPIRLTSKPYLYYIIDSYSIKNLGLINVYIKKLASSKNRNWKSWRLQQLIKLFEVFKNQFIAT